MECIDKLSPVERRELLATLVDKTRHFNEKNNLDGWLSGHISRCIDDFREILEHAGISVDDYIRETVQYEKDDLYSRLIQIALLQVPGIAGMLYCKAHSCYPVVQGLGIPLMRLVAAFIGYIIFIDYTNPVWNNRALENDAVRNLVNEVIEKLHNSSNSQLRIEMSKTRDARALRITMTGGSPDSSSVRASSQNNSQTTFLTEPIYAMADDDELKNAIKKIDEIKKSGVSMEVQYNKVLEVAKQIGIKIAPATIEEENRYPTQTLGYAIIALRATTIITAAVVWLDAMASPNDVKKSVAAAIIGFGAFMLNMIVSAPSSDSDKKLIDELRENRINRIRSNANLEKNLQKIDASRTALGGGSPNSSSVCIALIIAALVVLLIVLVVQITKKKSALKVATPRRF